MAPTRGAMDLTEESKMAKELDKIQEAAEELGYELVRMTRKSHYLYKHTETGNTVTIAGTPSDPRSFKNALSRLRSGAK